MLASRAPGAALSTSQIFEFKSSRKTDLRRHEAPVTTQAFFGKLFGGEKVSLKTV